MALDLIVPVLSLHTLYRDLENILRMRAQQATHLLYLLFALIEGREFIVTVS